MNSSATSGPTPVLSESQKAALLNLLTDDDPTIYQIVRGKILAHAHALAHGRAAKEWLRPCTLSSDPILRRRAQEILDHLERQAADNRFLAFCLSRGEDLNVEQGAWLLAQTQYPNINILAYQALFDSYAGDLRERIDFGDTPDSILATINHYLFTEMGFTGNEQNYYEPDNSYLNRVMDRRTGNPISLCLVYLSLARRLRLPMTGIGMPTRFLCRFQTPTFEIYLDAFNKGRLLTKADCVKYLHQTRREFHDGFLSPTSPRRMLLRMCSNLHQIYANLGWTEDTTRLQHYIVALSK